MTHTQKEADAELRHELCKIVNNIAADLGMAVLWKDEDPIDTGVGDKYPPYYWTDKIMAAVQAHNARNKGRSGAQSTGEPTIYRQGTGLHEL